MSNQSAQPEPDNLRPPLAWGLHGDPIDVPLEAAGWRVKRLPLGGGRAGAPEVVYAGGVPLQLGLDATPEELWAAVKYIAGRYRLDPVDLRSLVISGSTPAYLVLEAPPAPPPEPEPPAAGQVSTVDPLARALDTIERMAQGATNSITRMVEQQAVFAQQQSQLVGAIANLVNAVDAAGVSSRQPPPVIVATPPADPAAAAAAATAAKPAAPPPTGIEQFSKLVESLGPMLKALPGILEFVKSMAPTPASPSPGPGTPPHPETPPSPTPYSNGTHTGAGGAS